MNGITREKLSADFKAVIGDVDELVRAASAQTGERIAALRQRLGKTIETGRNALSRQEPLRVKAEGARASAEAHLHGKRWVLVVLAAGIGVALGLLLSPRD